MKVSESEFARICDGLSTDRKSIIKHNPIGSDEEILLWMLLNTLVIYMSLSEVETPCFKGKPDASTFREAIIFVLANRRKSDFDVNSYIDSLLRTA